MNSEEILDIDCVFDGFLGTGAIFVSGFEAARSQPTLARKNIIAVISIARSGKIPENSALKGYLHIPAVDSEEYPLHTHFEETTQFLEKYRKQGNVLVHCMQGISRSVSIVAAYLLTKYKYSLQHILSLLERKRQKAKPNKGFIQQLKTYSLNLGISQTCEIRKIKKMHSFSVNTSENQKNDNKMFGIDQEVKSQTKDKKQENASTSKSLEKSKEEQRSIEQKIQKLREHVMKVGKRKSVIRNQRMKAMIDVIESTGSASLPQECPTKGLRKLNSLELN